MKYDKADYAKERLGNTVIRINNRVVYVYHKEGWTYSVYDLKTGESENIDLREADVDLNPVPLGYLNQGGRAYYTTRRPRRRWKQGLDQESMKVVYNDEERHALGAGGLLTSKGIVECIENTYPTASKAINDIAKGECSSVAFSRSFAVEKNMKGKRVVYNLLYKSKNVGFISREGIDLSSKYLYLKEALEEALK